MAEQREDLARAQQLGRLKAERLDQELRAAEQRERESRLANYAWDVDAGLPGEPGDLEPGADSGELWRLRQEVERLTAFHTAVLRSRSWRFLQWVRRPLGRAW
ncbi:MAG TPA: hypothetical protein VMM92_06540 [Thermoanaerobaculia bacterium]|nr:hypothetical protein [Thermoanaerobaculia bacterium]